MRYLLLFFADEDAWMALAEPERDALIQRIGAWYGEHARAGRIVEGCRVAGRSAATTLRFGAPGAAQAPTLTREPFFAAREALGSYAIVEAPSLDDALAIAGGWPGGGAVEVRPLLAE